MPGSEPSGVRRGSSPWVRAGATVLCLPSFLGLGFLGLGVIVASGGAQGENAMKETGVLVLAAAAQAGFAIACLWRASVGKVAGTFLLLSSVAVGLAAGFCATLPVGGASADGKILLVVAPAIAALVGAVTAARAFTTEAASGATGGVGGQA